MSKKTKKKRDSNKCKPGEILKKGYDRKGYQRNEYKRRDGGIIPTTFVAKTHVPPTCIKDMGKPGKGPKTLPELNKQIRLTRYGYGVHKPEAERRKALRAASNDFDTLKVYRRLNLIRNYQAVPEVKDIFSQDVEYMKKLYANIKKNKLKQRGGATNSEDTVDSDVSEGSDSSPITSDISVEELNLPENMKFKIDTVLSSKKICKNGTCNNYDFIFESHIINGRQVIYYTLGEKDVDDVFEFDKMSYPDIDRNIVMKKINNNSGLLIGMKVDDKLEGYCQFKLLENKEVEIVYFFANKGYRAALYIFVEKYFKMNDYVRIEIIVDMNTLDAAQQINFWYDMDYKIYKTQQDRNLFLMEKFI